MKKLHQTFQKILEEMNAELSSEDSGKQVEEIIRRHLELALKHAGEEIERTFALRRVVVSVQIREVCVYSQKEEDS